MKIEILEDCYPYYVRFTHEGIEELISASAEVVKDKKFFFKFSHNRFNRDDAERMLECCPLKDYFNLDVNRVSMFVSQPGLYYRAHKDGMNHRFSINYTVKILDEKCVTSWYSDEDLARYSIDNLQNSNSRECIGFNKSKHTPIKTMVAKPGECVLFNTDIFHDWDNSESENERMVLTFRLASYDDPNSYFEDARKIILDIANNK